MPTVWTNPLHLYRALLRECTYLPDSIARTRMRDHVRSRFRVYAPRKHQAAASLSKQTIPPQEPLLDPRRQHHALRQARQGLYTLRRANEGYNKPLLKVLCLTYGQVGKRRYELLDQMHKEETLPEDNSANNPTKDWEVGKHHINAKLDALMQSRLKNQSHFTLRDPIKMGHMQIPKTNRWGKPTPQKRVKNLQRKRYRKLMEGMVAPLPKLEWQHLQLVASDRAAIEDLIPRRPRANSDASDEVNPGLDDSFLVDGPEKGPNYGRLENGRAHKMTRKYLQSMWQALFNDSARMTWNSDKKRWDVEWGFMHKKNNMEYLIHEADVQDVSLFGNIDIPDSVSNQR